MAPHGRKAGIRERPRGFSLTELLVVISIICLMMSLLLPSLTRAQRQAEQTHCLANQHQLGLAWHQIVAEQDDRIPMLHGPEQMASYVYNVNEVFLCKSVARNEGGMSVWGKTIDSCYGFAANMCGQSYDGTGRYRTLHSVSHPGRQLLLTDIDPDALGMDFRPVIKSRGRWMWNPWAGLVGINSQNMTARHNDGCNMTFVDGHGSYTRWKDARTLKFIKGIIAEPEEASADNPDLKYVVDILGGGYDANE